MKLREPSDEGDAGKSKLIGRRTPLGIVMGRGLLRRGRSGTTEKGRVVYCFCCVSGEGSVIVKVALYVALRIASPVG